MMFLNDYIEDIYFSEVYTNTHFIKCVKNNIRIFTNAVLFHPKFKIDATNLILP